MSEVENVSTSSRHFPSSGAMLKILASILFFSLGADAYNFGSMQRVVDVTARRAGSLSRRQALATALSSSAVFGVVAAGPAPAFAGSLSQLVSGSNRT